MNAIAHTASDKIRNGERIEFTEALALYQQNDLLLLAELANRVKHTKSGQNVYFNVNRHINLTNICHARCPLCAFGCDATAEHAFVLDRSKVEKMVRQAAETCPEITEIHIVSALHPDKPFSYFLDIIQAVKAQLPAVSIKAFTPVEIIHFAKTAGLTIETVLAELKAAGLGSLPGGGAEILDDSIRREICPNKATTAEWITVIKTAHRLGLPTNATMLYGHIETLEQRLKHLFTIREIQDETGGFQAYVGFPFHPENTELAKKYNIRRVSAWEGLKMIAMARLILDNIDHIKAFWMMLTLPVTQLSLAFGVDDLDGTVVEEKIIHAAGAVTKKGITKQELAALIAETGLRPVERDTFYQPITINQGVGQ
ncbi:Aminodeoxyfutalosine synthase [Sporomusa rhizae]|uniref:aminofutalosine synthase MqnE n=1 Tax=Sporomusa rhizae TaxID=357999 RepID=UPI00352A7465